MPPHQQEDFSKASAAQRSVAVPVAAPVFYEYDSRLAGCNCQPEAYCRALHPSRTPPLQAHTAPRPPLQVLRSPMPGNLISVAVAPGDEVAAGDELAVVEAMKMRNVLRADAPVRVASVEATPGTILAADQVILRFE